MSLADAVVPQPWSDYSAAVCIALILLGGVVSLIVGLHQPKPTDSEEEL